MRHLKHKTADLIMRHDYDQGPLHLYSGITDEFESLMFYVKREAVLRDCRFRIQFNCFSREVTISKI